MNVLWERGRHQTNENDIDNCYIVAFLLIYHDKNKWECTLDVNYFENQIYHDK